MNPRSESAVALITVLIIAYSVFFAGCDERKTKPTSTDPCMQIAEGAIGNCMDTKGSGPVKEERVRFCTEQYVAIVNACRCESEFFAPVEAPLPEVP